MIQSIDFIIKNAMVFGTGIKIQKLYYSVVFWVKRREKKFPRDIRMKGHSFNDSKIISHTIIIPNQH